MTYRVHRTPAPPPLDADWDDPAWSAAQTAEVATPNNPQRASDHRPPTRAQLLYDDAHLYLRFRVEDRYVRVVNTGHQAMVCRDSCVEFFFAPAPGTTPAAGVTYFNLETNAGGHKLLYHCTFRNNGKGGGGFDHEPIDTAWMDRIETWHSLPEKIEPEITEPTTWGVAMALPLALFEDRLGEPLTVGPGTIWRGNFYKCGDQTSHPHWLSWKPVTCDPLSFHHPPSFGELVFG